MDRNLRIYNFDGLYPNTIYVVEVTGNLDQVQSGTGSTRGRTGKFYKLILLVLNKAWCCKSKVN